VNSKSSFKQHVYLPVMDMLLSELTKSFDITQFTASVTSGFVIRVPFSGSVSSSVLRIVLGVFCRVLFVNFPE